MEIKKYLVNCERCKNRNIKKPHVIIKISKTKGVVLRCDCGHVKSRYTKFNRLTQIHQQDKSLKIVVAKQFPAGETHQENKSNVVSDLLVDSNSQVRGAVRQRAFVPSIRKPVIHNQEMKTYLNPCRCTYGAQPVPHTIHRIFRNKKVLLKCLKCKHILPRIKDLKLLEEHNDAKK